MSEDIILAEKIREVFKAFIGIMKDPGKKIWIKRFLMRVYYVSVFPLAIYFLVFLYVAVVLKIAGKNKVFGISKIDSVRSKPISKSVLEVEILKERVKELEKKVMRIIGNERVIDNPSSSSMIFQRESLSDKVMRLEYRVSNVERLEQRISSLGIELRNLKWELDSIKVLKKRKSSRKKKSKTRRGRV